MRRVLGYTALMMSIVILLPLLIVRSCGKAEEKEYPEPQPGSTKINVYVHTKDKVVAMDLEDYLKGVVAAEMPAEFEMEALKAQAVAARTYAIGRMMKVYVPKNNTHEGADVCTDSTHCQAWMSESEALRKWSIFTARRNWRKIENAVEQTRGILITYQKSIANPLFHSNSGGRTENAEDVWGGAPVPYLRSVPSEGEEDSIQYKNTVHIKVDDFLKTVDSKYPEANINEDDVFGDIVIHGYTEGGRVRSVSIGDVTLKGTEFRELFSLKSSNFTVEDAGDGAFIITTYGYGHGVGMSQYGANYLAKKGGGFEEILKYYYTGVELMTLERWQAGMQNADVSLDE